MSGELSAAIGITIDPSGSIRGANQVNSALDSIIQRGQRVSASNDNTSGSLDRLGRSMGGAGREGGALSRVLDDIRGRAAGATPAVGGLISQLIQFGGKAAVIGTVALAIAAVGTKAIAAAAQVQTWKASLETVTGSAEKAQGSYAALVGFASSTPFDLGQSVEGFIKLRSLGIAATEERMTSFGNTASAMGKSLNQMIEAVADASTGEFERLKEFGIKSKSEGDKVSFTFQGVTTTVGKNSKEITEYLENIGKTTFGGAMARQMDTLNGAFSNVKDNLFQMFAAIGEGQLGTAIKDIAKTISSGIAGLTPLFAGIGNFVGSIISGVGSVINGITSIFVSLNTGGAGVQPMLDFLTGAFNGIAQVVTFLGSVIGDVFGGIGSAISTVLTDVRDFIGLNQEAAEGQASWAQIGTAALDTLKEGWASAKEYIGTVFSDLWSNIKSTFSGAGSSLADMFSGPLDAIKGMFSGVADFFSETFGDLDFSPEGIVIGTARAVDLMIGVFRGGFNIITVLWNELPGAIWASLGPGMQGILSGIWSMLKNLGSGVASVFRGIANVASGIAASVANVINSVIGKIEQFANGALSVVNKVIAGANKLGAGLSPLAAVAMSRVGTGGPKVESGGAFSDLQTKMGKAWQSGFSNGAENAARGLISRARGISVGGSGGLDSGTDATPAASGASGGKPAGSRGAGGQSEAEKLAAKIDDFWKKLESDSADAEATFQALAKAATEGKNLSIASAETSKQLEFQRLAGRDITEQERERIALALQTGRTAKFLTDALTTGETRMLDIAREADLLKARQTGMSEGQLAVEKDIIKFRQDALQAGMSLEDARYKAAEAKLRVDLQSAQAIADQNKKLDEQAERLRDLVETGKGAADRYSPLYRQMLDKKAFDKDRDGLQAALDKGEISKAVFDEATRGLNRAILESANYYKMQWIDAIDDLARNFGGRFGEIFGGIVASLQTLRGLGTDRDRGIFGSLASLFGGSAREAYKDQGQKGLGDLVGAIKNPIKSMRDSFKNLTTTMTDPSQGGLGGMIGKGLAKAAQGAAIGGAIGGVGEMLGLGKNFSKGASIGGSIGGLFGPIGGIIGSLGGGLLGSIFGPSAKYGTAKLSGAGDPVVTGNKSAYSKAASGAAGSVQSGLSKLASELGGVVGAFDVMIGQYDGKWRVRDSSSGWNGKGGLNFKGKSKIGLNDFGDDQAGAIAYAIENAIKDGAITGLSDIVKKALSTLGTDAAVQFAKDWNAAMADFRSMTDPVGAAIENVTKPLDNLRETMLKIGASSTDLSKLEEYRAKKLDAVLKEQTSSFRDILDQLNGDAGGVSDFAQLKTKMKELDTFKQDIAAGKQVDQQAYSALVQSIMGKAGNVYGTQTAEYQNIVSTLKGSTQGALDNVMTAFKGQDQQAVVAAMVQQTDAFVANQQQTNTLLERLLAASVQNNELMAEMARGGGIQAYNARVVMAY